MPAFSVCNSLVNNKKGVNCAPQRQICVPPTGREAPAASEVALPLNYGCAFPTHTNKHETPREGLCAYVCVCVFTGSKVGVCVGNEQRFPYCGFRLSRCEERGNRQRGTKDKRQADKVGFVFFRAQEIQQTKRGRVRRREKVRKKLKEE